MAQFLGKENWGAVKVVAVLLIDLHIASGENPCVKTMFSAGGGQHPRGRAIRAILPHNRPAGLSGLGKIFEKPVTSFQWMVECDAVFFFFLLVLSPFCAQFLGQAG